MSVDPNELLNVEEAKLESHDPVVIQNSRHQLYFNPHAMARFDGTVVTPTEAVGFKILSATEIALFFIKPGTDNAVPFKRPSNKRTGHCSFMPILTQKPFLKVRPGRQHRYPFRLDVMDDGVSTCFVLLIEKPKIAPTRSYGRKAKSAKKSAPATHAAGLMPDDDLDGEI